MKLLIKKLLYLIVMLFTISLISFIAISAASNSFFAGGELNPNIIPESIEQLKAVYRLDKPLYIQSFSWIYSILKLDFGTSFSSGEMAKDEILNRIPITFIIDLISVFLIFIISLYFGIKSALNRNSFFDKATEQLSLLNFAMPSFHLTPILVLVFTINFEIFPMAGLHSVPNDGSLTYYLDYAWYLTLSIFITVFGGIGSLILYIRSLTVEISKSGYIFFAHARGSDKKQILGFYILPSLHPPVIILLGLSLPGIIGGSVMPETIFSIDGMGLLFYQNALSHDYPVIMGILVIGAFLTLVGSMIADLFLLKLNSNYQGK